MNRIITSIMLMMVATVQAETISHAYKPRGFVIQEITPRDPTHLMLMLADKSCPNGWDLNRQWSRKQTDGKSAMFWDIDCLQGDLIHVTPATPSGSDPFQH